MSYYETERDKLDTFMEESLMQIEDELKSLKDQWQDARRKKNRAETAEERNLLRDNIDRFEAEYRRKIMKSQEENMRQMDEKKQCLKELENKMRLRQSIHPIAVVEWEMV